MTKTKDNKLTGIRSKLTAAVCMLLVAVIMVVSSTYAWFTLSTAPEVTGITTAVGANGALEMLLLTKDANENLVYNDGTLLAGDDVNTYWGNLVDLSGKDGGVDYGLNKITLYPSTLNLVDGKIGSAMLNTPSYGADGRVSQVTANAVPGTLVTNDNGSSAFYANSNFGVRAVGVSSSMTERQLAYRNAISAASSAMGSAKNLAAQSLNTNGSALANIAIARGVDSTAKYSQTDVASLRAIVTDLTSVIAKIEGAYAQYIVAYAAGASGGEDAEGATPKYVLVQGLLAGDADSDGTTNTLYEVVELLAAEGITLPDAVAGYIDDLETTKTNVVSAAGALATLEGYGEDAVIEWADAEGSIGLSTPLYKLADIDAMEVNGIAANQIKEGNNMSTLVNSVASSGLTVTMATGGGVYADVADHCGDYTASVTIEEVTYNGLTLNNLNARMVTDSDAETPYLTLVGTAVTNAGNPPAAASGETPISEYYGYIIDLAFRTNAAESNLLLQVDAADRIYDDNNNEATMGGGSSMTFAATSTDFTNDQVKKLMNCIRIVFFDPATNEPIAEARLDTANATIGADGVTADMKMWDSSLPTPAFKADDNQVITALAQSKEKNISVLVYLDGATITNADVAATEYTSMTGKMNLQFASSANLIPMEYSDLHITDGTTTEEGTTGNQG